MQYGYKITKIDVNKTLADGTKLTGRKAVSTYKATEYTRQVLVHKARDSGLVILTQTEKATPLEEKQIVDLFWKTLKISLK